MRKFHRPRRHQSLALPESAAHVTVHSTSSTRTRMHKKQQAKKLKPEFAGIVFCFSARHCLDLISIQPLCQFVNVLSLPKRCTCEVLTKLCVFSRILSRACLDTKKHRPLRFRCWIGNLQSTPSNLLTIRCSSSCFLQAAEYLNTQLLPYLDCRCVVILR